MSDQVWLSLTTTERTILIDALASFAGVGERAKSSLVRKLAFATQTPHPKITVGVYGGVVQWVMGNPFPVRIIDYDGEPNELPDVDEDGERCTIGFQ